MENNTTLGKRLQLLMDEKKATKSELSRLVGASNSYFSKAVNDEINISSKFLEKIIREYPDINAEWLITGEGDMYKSTNVSTQNTINSLRLEILELQNKLITCLEHNLYGNQETPTKKSI